MNAEDKSDEVKDKTSSNNEPNLGKENEKFPTINTKDVNNGQQYSNKQIKFDKKPTVKTEVSEENHHEEEEADDYDDDDDVDKESNGYNSDQSKEITAEYSAEEASNEDDANQLEMTIDVENYALSDNNSRSLIQREYSTIEGQNVEINNMEELTYLIEDEDNNGTENELIFILRVQRDTELEEPTDSITRDRSRSIINRQIRPQRGRRRRRRRRGRRRRSSQEIRQVQQQALPEGPIKGEVEVEDVEYEWITSETVPRGRPRTWRIVPKYKGLTTAEAARQEADLYYSFMNETNPEDVEMAGPHDRQCCVCYEYKATRIVIPCGHYCLCYNCAKSIAFSRTTLSSIRIPKTCPLCKAAISAMKRPL